MKANVQNITVILKPLSNTQIIWNGWNKNTDEDNQYKKVLIVFDFMIADMLSNRKFNPMVT